MYACMYVCMYVCVGMGGAGEWAVCLCGCVSVPIIIAPGPGLHVLCIFYVFTHYVCWSMD